MFEPCLRLAPCMLNGMWRVMSIFYALNTRVPQPGWICLIMHVAIQICCFNLGKIFYVARTDGAQKVLTAPSGSGKRGVVV